MERLKAIFQSTDYIPFMLMAGHNVKMSWARIIEALIIAAIAGGVAVWGVTMTLEAKQDAFTSMYEWDRTNTTNWRVNVQKEIDETQKYLYIHDHSAAKK